MKKISKIITLFLMVSMLSTTIAPIYATTENTSLNLESNRFTHMESSREVIQKHNDLTNYSLMQENDKIRLYVNKKSLGIKIQDKTTGYIWSSDREFREDEQLNKLWKNYILSGVTMEYYDSKKKKIVNTSTLNEKAKVNVSKEEDKIKYEINFNKLDIKFNVYLNIQDNKLIVAVPYEQVEENGKNKITSVILFPFLGSTERAEIPGYIFVPDGSGALMRFEERSVKLNSPFNAKVYGKDYGIDLITFATANSNTESYRLSLPVFGIVHGANKNAFLAKINKGSAYATLMVYPSGVTTEYNWSTFQFKYRQEFFHPTGKDGSGFSDLQQDINKIDIELEYAFLNNEDADYIGMAKEYKKDLFANKSTTLNSSVPTRLDVLGSEIKKWLLGFTTTTLTKTEDVINMVSEFKTSGLDNILVVYKGWTKGGLSSRLPSKFPFDKKQGGEKGFKKLISYMQEQDVKLYFAADYSTAYDKGSGYNKRKDLIRRIDDIILSFTRYQHNYDVIWYALNPQATEKLVKKDTKKYTKLGMNIALDKTSYQLYGDYQKGPDREVTKEKYINIFSSLKEKVDLVMYRPNDYLLRETNAYLDIPMNASGYMYFTDTVPFLQILLSGYVDYYTPYLNFSSNPREDLLRTIEYKAYPSYILTEKSAYHLDDTPSEHIYSSEYSTWKDKIIEDATEVKEALKDVVNAEIIERIILSEGISQVKYSNGVSIYVNYTNKDYHIKGLTIKARDYLVTGGE